jgi:hypothetical protein
MTRKLHSGLPLPRYMRRKFLRSNTWSYFFDIPTWARRSGCTVPNEALGTDYGDAVFRVEKVLLPVFDSWHTKGASDLVPAGLQKGTLDWIISEFKSSPKWKGLSYRTQVVHESGFCITADYQLKDGRRLGEVRAESITTAVIDAVYEKLLFVSKRDLDGKEIVLERRTTVNHAMKSLRRAWNIVDRLHPGRLPRNPFSRMGLRSNTKLTPTANFHELRAFRAKAIELGRPTLATAALIAWEWSVREADIFCRLQVSDYRPKERPDAVRILHTKTNEEAWIPLSNEEGEALFPDLVAELDEMRRKRIGGLLIVREGLAGTPWPTKNEDLTFMRHEVKRIMKTAGLREELSFRSFRHGGFTEAADSDLTDAEIRSLGRHRSSRVLPRYAKRTMKQVASAAEKRLRARTKKDHLSE